MSPDATNVEVDGRSLSVSNLDKVLYPATGFTKAAVIDYYVKVAPVLLRHLAGRPLTMLRFPDGVDGGRFFEKRCPDHRPEWLPTVTLGREGRDKLVDHCDIREVAGLVWVANLASLELHTSLARGPDTFTPTMVVFDLDPGPPAGILACADVAWWLKEVFDRLDLVSAVKTSGSKGLQVYVPVNRPGVTYDETRDFALAVGRLLERVHGDAVVTNMKKELRRGKVLVDWSQNHLTKTTVSVYSLRARERPTVSTPLTWDELASAREAQDPHLLDFDAPAVLERIEAHGDLFARVEDVAQALPRLA